MRPILKPLFDFLVDKYTLFNNPIYNYLIMLLIGMVAFIIAWRLVGALYRLDIIESRIMGSLIHWALRFLVFSILVLLGSVLIAFIKIVLEIPLWKWIIILVMVFAILILIRIINNRIN